MKKVVLLLLIFMSFKGYSQMKVGINPKSIDSSAMFQVDVNQTAGKAKGLLLPRVPLNSTTDVATILGPATGLVVYAKGGTLAEGLYVWDGAKWQKMSDSNLDLDKDSTNEIQKLSLSGDIIRLNKNGDSVSIAQYRNMAKNGLNVSNDSVVLGGILDRATTITTSSTNTLAVSGLQSGASTDSIMVLNPTTGVLARRSPSSILSGATTNTLSSSANTMTNTTNGVVGTAPIVNSISNIFNSATQQLTTTVNGVVSSAITLTDGPDSTTASNGLTLNGKDVRLGGTLTSATTITTSSTNTLAISGLGKGTTSDSVLLSSGSTGIVKKISVPELRKLNIAITAATSYTVSDTLDAVIFNGTANTIFTIPAASSCKGKEIRFMNYAKSASNISITLSAPVVYEGDVSNITHTVINSKMTVYEYPEGLGSQYGNTITIISDGTDWYKVGM